MKEGLVVHRGLRSKVSTCTIELSSEKARDFITFEHTSNTCTEYNWEEQLNNRRSYICVYIYIYKSDRLDRVKMPVRVTELPVRNRRNALLVSDEVIFQTSRSRRNLCNYFRRRPSCAWVLRSCTSSESAVDVSCLRIRASRKNSKWLIFHSPASTSWKGEGS